MKVCFICSAARSGSTLLDILLGGHPVVASLGEINFLGKSIAMNENCSCGVKVVDCPKWLKILKLIMSETGINMLKSPYGFWQWDTLVAVKIDRSQQTNAYLLCRKLRSLCCDMRYLSGLNKFLFPLPPTLNMGRANSMYLYKTVSNEWNKKMVVDSSKNVHKALAIYEKFPEQTKIIYLVRDGRGVFYSRRHSGFSRWMSVKGWLNYNLRASTLIPINVDPADVYFLKYEDLAIDPEYTLQKLFSFLDLPMHPGVVDLMESERHLPSGNDTRFLRNKGVRIDERWRKELISNELRYFNSIAGRLNRKFGYL